MARETTLTAITAARSIQSLPDGRPIPKSAAHLVLVLATYFPKVFPCQARLAADNEGIAALPQPAPADT
jgi:hypothetical protein